MQIGDSVRSPGSPCLQCDKVLDAGMMAGGNGNIRPGALSICFYCGYLGIYDDNLKVRRLTPEELVEIRLSDQWEEIQYIIKALKYTKDKVKEK